MKSSQTTKIVIGGGGFAGAKAARELARHGLPVTLISASTDFAYYPQLYHAATGGVRSESSIPLAELLEGLPVTIVHDTLTRLDPEHQMIEGKDGEKYHYDELVLALGNVTNYFGIKGLDTFSYGIKSINEAMRFKEHLHQQLVEEHKPDPHYIVIGAGPTGVELAGALREYLDFICRRHDISTRSITVELVEAAPRILPRSPEVVARRVAQRLERLGVKIATNMKVEAETAEDLEVQGRAIRTRTVIWTAGVANNPFYKAQGELFSFDKGSRVVVDEHLQAVPHVYVLGDNAATQYTGLAQTAVSDAAFIAANLRRQQAGQPLWHYRPHRPINVIPVGRGWASVDYSWLHFSGYIAWLIRRVADLVAYQDMERLGPALRVWLKDGKGEESCSLCSPAGGHELPMRSKE